MFYLLQPIEREPAHVPWTANMKVHSRYLPVPMSTWRDACVQLDSQQKKCIGGRCDCAGEAILWAVSRRCGTHINPFLFFVWKSQRQLFASCGHCNFKPSASTLRQAIMDLLQINFHCWFDTKGPLRIMVDWRKVYIYLTKSQYRRYPRQSFRHYTTAITAKRAYWVESAAEYCPETLEV